MYDIIGDIHGHATSLKQLLEKMQYHETDGAWSHHNRHAIFVGDYIDRGPSIRETLQIVRSMVETGNATALMGNHEYNALAYAFKSSDGYLRSHNDKNHMQHAQTVEQFAGFAEEWQSHLEWFYHLPLFLELPGMRAVHACWDDGHIDWLKERGSQTMDEQLLIDSHKKGSQAYKVINDVLKGKEFAIPEKYAWMDKDGHTRNQNRIKWWSSPKKILWVLFCLTVRRNLKIKCSKKKLMRSFILQMLLLFFSGTIGWKMLSR